MNKAEINITPPGQLDSDQQLPSNLLCFSHLRWDFVFQRPQHLLTRFASSLKVFFLEEPLFEDIPTASLDVTVRDENLWTLVPRIPVGLEHQEIIGIQKNLLEGFLEGKDAADFTFWYYTPMALEFSDHLQPALTVYDCMDELSAFKFAPAGIKQFEQSLLHNADIVFTGGHSLYEAKKHQHANIWPFPSSIERAHFEKARHLNEQPADQAGIPGPRIGFFGVIDERFDIDLISGIADARPDWQLILIGPVVKIDPATLPQRPNIHYLGQKNYRELPHYLAGWDAALIPFLLNESTRFISPTKTPEYLAAGIPVISTPIQDVVKPYGENGMVHIARNDAEFIKAIEKELQSAKEEWLALVDDFLAQNSWDLTSSKMLKLMKGAKARKQGNKISISIN